MKNKVIILLSLILLILLVSGCNTKQKTEVDTLATFEQEMEINILATADLHGTIPNNLVSYVESERKKDVNLTLVDAGDFFDIQSKQMWEWFWGKKLVKVDSRGTPTFKTVAKEREGEAPIAREMGRLKYDAVVLGNHEFVSNNKESLDSLISDFKNNNMPILSANTYEVSGKNYTKPYIIRNISTDKGDVNVGILGLTIKEVGEKFTRTEEGERIIAKSRDLNQLNGYKGKLYMNDLVIDAKKWVDIMEKDNVDIVVAVIHSGEEPKNPKNPGNRIKELAQEVNGIDAIVAGHTHEKISQHDYKNKSGETVIVTQPGKHGEYISRINFKLKKSNYGWAVLDKSSKIVKL